MPIIDGADDNLTASEFAQMLEVLEGSLPIIKTGELPWGNIFPLRTVGELRDMLRALPGNKEIESGIDIVRFNKDRALVAISFVSVPKDTDHFRLKEIPEGLFPDPTSIMIRGTDVYAGSFRFHSENLPANTSGIHLADFVAAKMEVFTNEAPDSNARKNVLTHMRKVAATRRPLAA